MNIVQKIHDVTYLLYQVLNDSEIENEKRDDAIEQIEQLLENRQQLLNELKGPFSDEENELGQKIIEYNKVIDEKLVLLKGAIQTDINKLKKQKTTNEKYVNPYKNVSFDGMFFDKKK